MNKPLSGGGCWRLALLAGAAPVLLAVGFALLYQVPAVHERLAFRLATLRADVIRRVRPQPDLLPTPLPPAASSVAEAAPPTNTPAPLPTQSAAPVTGTPPPSASPIPTATPLPVAASVANIPFEWQGWNNCGPATLSMNLQYLGWEGDQYDAAAWLKPNGQDKNVSPGEIEAYVREFAPGMAANYRVGGSLPLLRTFIAAGYPVMVGKGLWNGEDGWLGHYLLLTGYDDEAQELIFQDALHGPEARIAFDAFDEDWQAFNRTFIVVYPAARAGEVKTLLGGNADLEGSYSIALETARAETQADPGNAFAWHNLGMSQNFFGDYAAAAVAFDEARTIGLPWRMLWYQTGLYSAYYNVARYDEVRVLANLTLDSALGVPIEENLYWRGRAKDALGDTRSARRDFELALDFNPNFAPAREALADLDGAATP